MSSPNAMPTLADLFGDIHEKFFPRGAKVIHASAKDDVRRLLAMGYHLYYIDTDGDGDLNAQIQRHIITEKHQW